MSGHIPRPIGSIALVATLLVSGVGIGVPANIARADHCLSVPNYLAPQGSHWYYQLDWATQRKCWYLRAFGPPAQQAAAPAPGASLNSMPASSEPLPAADGAPISSPGDTASPARHFKRLAVKPKSAQAITATADKLDQRDVQEGNTGPSMIEASAPQASTSSQTGVQAAGPAPAARIGWPDAPPAVAPVRALDPIAVPTDVPADSVSGDGERIARSGEPTQNAGMPIIIFTILALVLAAGGALSRVIIKTVAAHRAESQSIDDQHQHVSVDEKRELNSLISAVSDSGPLRAEGDYQIAHEISKRRDKLAQLRQVLDRLLQHEPREARDLAMTGAG
jgi:hypothetical protein